jgi:hypothetical protein
MEAPFMGWLAFCTGQFSSMPFSSDKLELVFDIREMHSASQSYTFAHGSGPIAVIALR